MLSLLDTDLYIFSVSNAFFQLYPLAEGTMVFNDRNKEVYDQEFIETLKIKFAELENLRLTNTEFIYVVNKIPYISRTYWEWLKTFKFEPYKIEVGFEKILEFLYGK